MHYSWTANGSATATVTFGFRDGSGDDAYEGQVNKNGVRVGAKNFSGMATRTFSVVSGDVITISVDTFVGAFYMLSFYNVSVSVAVSAATTTTTTTAAPTTTTVAPTTTTTTTSPPNGDANYNAVSLLLHLDNNLTDNSSSPKTCSLSSVGTDGAIFSTDAAKFGTHGIQFNGVSVASSEEYNNNIEFSRISAPIAGLPANWTYEMWFKPQSAWGVGNNSTKTLACAGDRYYSLWDLSYGNSNLVFSMSHYDWGIEGGAFTNITVSRSVGTISADWHHVAVSRDGTSIRLFLDGVLLGSAGTLGSDNVLLDPSGPIAIPNPVYIGANATYDLYQAPWANGWAGSVDDIRITNATRYTSNFTIPSSPFPNNS
jgi:hypothetical protein